MPITVKRGRYLVGTTRRAVQGAIARVGTGGSVPAPVQKVLDGYIQSLKAQGSDPRMERETIRTGMKQMAGTWLVLSPAGIRWASSGSTPEADKKSIQVALRNSGWSVPAAQLDELVAKKG